MLETEHTLRRSEGEGGDPDDESVDAVELLRSASDRGASGIAEVPPYHLWLWLEYF